MPADWDVVVVGGGPAGSLTAALLAGAGHRVLLLDRARFPRPKVCGEYLSPACAPLLARHGLLEAVRAAGPVPLRGMRISAPGGVTLEAAYPGTETRALSVARATFDACLLEGARARGAVVREGTAAVDLLREGRAVRGVRLASGESVAARLVVGADGRASMVARRLGRILWHPRLRRVALVAHLRGLPATEWGEIALGRGVYGILNPLPDGWANLGIVLDARVLRTFRGDRGRAVQWAMDRLPALRGCLRGAAESGFRAVGPLAYTAERPAAPGALLVGDAAGFLDPFTGEGIYTALRGAELAASAARRALSSGSSTVDVREAYAAARAELVPKWRFCTLLQEIIRRPLVAHLVARRLAARPAVLGLVMGVVGDLQPPGAVLSLPVLARLLA